MRAAVIGGAGFLGSHVVERLAADARGLLVVDDLSSGKLEWLGAARRQSRVGFHSLDVDHPQAAEVLDRFDPDVVFLLLDAVGPDRGTIDPSGTAQTAVGRVAALAEACRRTNAKLVLAVDARDLYGEVVTQPVREAQRPKPLTPAGAAMYAALRYAEARLGADWCGLAVGPLYGPRQLPGHGLVATVGREMLRGRTPTVRGEPHDAYDWVYVDDAAAAVVLAGEIGRGLINIGTGTATSTADLVAALAETAGYDGPAVQYAPDPYPYPHLLSLDPEVATGRIGWRPRTSLTDGMKRTVAWIQSEA